MSVRRIGALSAALCFVTIAAQAQAPAQAKIAIINLQRAVVETAEIKKAQVELEAKFKPRQAELEKINKELQSIQQQLQSGKLNQLGEQELSAQGQRRQRDLQRLSEDLQGDVDRERNDILSRTSQRMQEVVRKLAEERGIELVIDVTNAFYFKPTLEITKDAVAAYDKTYPTK